MHHGQFSTDGFPKEYYIYSFGYCLCPSNVSPDSYSKLQLSFFGNNCYVKYKISTSKCDDKTKTDFQSTEKKQACVQRTCTHCTVVCIGLLYVIEYVIIHHNMKSYCLFG